MNQCYVYQPIVYYYQPAPVIVNNFCLAAAPPPIHSIPYPDNYKYIYNVLTNLFLGNIKRTAEWLGICRGTVYSAIQYCEDPFNYDYRTAGAPKILKQHHIDFIEITTMANPN